MKISTQAIIFDDHNLFVDGFTLLLERYQIFDFIKSATTKRDFFRFLESFGNEEIFIFLDYYLLDENGLALLPDINRLNKKAKIIFLTSALSPVVIANIKKYAPHGILSKSCSIEVLKSCVDTIKEGSEFIDPFFVKLIADQNSGLSQFTPREIELLKYFAQGETIAKTAKKTFLSPHTIVAHRRKMMAKANCKSITQMLNFAKENELI